MPRIVLRFAHDETGATAIEYGLIAAGISIAIIAAVARHIAQHDVYNRIDRTQIVAES